jgi:hypothetical protein
MAVGTPSPLPLSQELERCKRRICVALFLPFPCSWGTVRGMGSYQEKPSVNDEE